MPAGTGVRTVNEQRTAQNPNEHDADARLQCECKAIVYVSELVNRRCPECGSLHLVYTEVRK